MSGDVTKAVVMAGVPNVNKSLYHAIRFNVGDPVGLVITQRGGAVHRLLIVRDIEMARAKQHAAADAVACPADYEPTGGLSGDRETATAQAVAEAVARAGCDRVIADRSLPLVFTDQLMGRAIAVAYDAALGVTERRAKDEQEIECLRAAQAVTEGAVRLACEMIAGATAERGGALVHDGAPLTAERVRSAIDMHLLEQGYRNPTSIIAPGPQGADCHRSGDGVIRTGEPVIVDVFPECRATRYNGDCTRTVVHGDVPDDIARMHATVVEAKAAATALVCAGATGEQVHHATQRVLEDHGYSMGFQSATSPTTMPHGTGHGIGLDVHEPPLLDFKGPPLVVGDALTIEPGLYNKQLGGVRVEDMVIVTDRGCDNLNTLPEGLQWR